MKSPMMRHALFVLGLVSVALGAAGVVLPLLPTTPFLLMAAWCFVRSSDRAHDWIQNHSVFGPPLRDWEKNKAIAKRTKALALVLIAISMISMWIKIENFLLKGTVTALLISVSVFILTRNEPKSPP